MLKAIRITKENLNTIEAETGIPKESMQLIASSRDRLIVIGSDISHGKQTYQKHIFDDLFRFVGKDAPHQFVEVKFK